MAKLAEIIARRHDPRVQLTPEQIEVMAAAIITRAPGCRLLVFGVGFDSPLWAAINSSGHTEFVEDFHEWAAAGERLGLAVHRFAYPTTVADTLAAPDTVIAAASLPPFLAGTRWDVVVIDGPTGWQPGHPGRALPIVWATQASDASTHIFLHDCQRPLETALAQRLLWPRGPWTVIPGGRDRALLWSIGRSPGFVSRAPT